MKQLCTAYTFDPITKQIDFVDLSVPIVLEQVLVVFNVTDNVSLYNFVDSANAGATIANNVLTLPAGVNTASMSATDHLLIYLDIQDYRDLIPTPVVIDDSQPFVTSGQDATGMKHPLKVGADGGLQASDAPGLLSFFLNASVLNSATPWIDTTGYQSISVQLNASPGGSGVIRLYGSNDMTNPQQICGWNSNGSNTSTSVIPGPGLNIFPCLSRYVRIGVGTAGTNTALPIVCHLRAAPVPLVPAYLSISGDVAAGSAPSQNPVGVAGFDGVNARRLLTGSDGAPLVAGPDAIGAVPGATRYPVQAAGTDAQSKVRRLLTDPAGVLQVNATLPPGDRTGPSIQEILLLILGELRALNIMTHEMPQVLNSGKSMNAEYLLTDDPTTNLNS